MRLHVVLHILYALSVFSDNALFGFFLCLVFRMLAVRTARFIRLVVVRTACFICLVAVRAARLICIVAVTLPK